jgi:branched-chain amino acid transport system substrate-binding protein
MPDSSTSNTGHPADQDPPARRRFLGSALGAAGLAWPALRSQAAEEQVIKVAWISPQTGALSSFGITDQYAVQLLAPQLKAGFDGPGGVRRRVEVTLHDAASSPAKAQALARELTAAGTHLLLTTATPEVVNPVSDVCEAAGVPCVSSVVPWQAWFLARGGEPVKGFNWTYHFFAGLEDFADVYSALLARARMGTQVGGLFGDDIDATAFLRAFPPAFAKRGLDLVVPQRVAFADPDWTPVVTKLRDAKVRMVTGVLPPPLAAAFFKTAQKLGYKPELASIAKAFPFHDVVAQIHQPGLTLTNEVWWSPAWPFKSSLTGSGSAQLAKDYETRTGRQWVQTLGFSHALLEVAAEAARSAEQPDRAALRTSLRRLRVNTVVGQINWLDRHPNQNVCTTPAVGGQWMRNAQGRWVLEVVDNTRSPFIPQTAQLTPG